MGRRLFTREVLASADVNELLMDQTVPRFPSASVRALDYPNPDANALSMLDTARGRVDYWHPTAGAAGAGIWLPLNYATVRGSMWRTAGFGPGVAASTEYVVPMQQNRVSGGFVYNLDALTVPLDGRYDIGWQTYATGGAAATGSSIVRRIRSGVADAALLLGHWHKPSAGIDNMVPFAHDGVPLKAGDRLATVFLVYSGAVVYYGANENHGSYLTVTYAGPLDGATPF